MNVQEASKKEFLPSRREALDEAAAFKRREAPYPAGDHYNEKKLAV